MKKHRKPGRASTPRYLNGVWIACTPWHGGAETVRLFITFAAAIVLGSTAITQTVLAI